MILALKVCVLDWYDPDSFETFVCDKWKDSEYWYIGIQNLNIEYTPEAYKQAPNVCEELLKALDEAMPYTNAVNKAITDKNKEEKNCELKPQHIKTIFENTDEKLLSKKNNVDKKKKNVTQELSSLNFTLVFCFVIVILIIIAVLVWFQERIRAKIKVMKELYALESTWKEILCCHRTRPIIPLYSEDTAEQAITPSHNEETTECPIIPSYNEETAAL